MKIELTISVLTPEENLLISKFADLLERRKMCYPEPTKEPTGRYIVLYPEAEDQVRRIKVILEENKND